MLVPSAGGVFHPAHTIHEEYVIPADQMRRVPAEKIDPFEMLAEWRCMMHARMVGIDDED